MNLTRRRFAGLCATPALLKAAGLEAISRAAAGQSDYELAGGERQDPAPGAAPGSLPRSPLGFPDAATTGHRNAPGYLGRLTPAATNIVATNGHTYRFERFDGLTLTASGNTFYGCHFVSNWTDGWNVLVQEAAAKNTFIHCTVSPPEEIVVPHAAWPAAGSNVAGMDGFNGASAFQIDGSAGYQYGFRILSGGGTIIDRCDIWGFGNAIDLIGGSNTTVIDTWIHDAAFERPKGYHTDGIGYLDGGAAPHNVLIRHCTIASLGNTNGIAFQAASTPYSDISVIGCFLSGFGYTVDMCHNVPGNRNLKFIDNTLSRIVKPGFGLLYADFSAQFDHGTTNEWSGNRDDHGQFVWPNGSVSASDWDGS